MKIFYDPRQSAVNNDSFSPSACKPAKVVESWGKLGIPVEIESFPPMTPEEISLVHDPAYVNGILSCSIENGFFNKSPEVAKVLPWVCGSMVASALYTFHTGKTSFSPTSGAHHAKYSDSGGYCTFNFLALAAIRAHLEGAKNVGIIDLDCHYGNGTIDIIQHLKWNFISHYSFSKQNVNLGNAENWLESLPKVMEKFKGADLLIFNAGVDAHVDDPLGGELTTEHLERRDRIVFSGAKMYGIPVCVSLAGGYQVEDDGSIEAVLRLHDATFKIAHEVVNDAEV